MSVHPLPKRADNFFVKRIPRIATLLMDIFRQLGRISNGHTIYISGLSCSMITHRRLEVSWFEKDVGASLVNLSCLPALLNSSCLHKLSHLSDLSSQISNMHICNVRLNQIENHHVTSRFSHSVCGHFVDERSDRSVTCSFCCSICDEDVIHVFHLKVTLEDETAKIFAACSGQTASELLQISPDEFYQLPEDEQAMYLYSLQGERFMVAIVNCKRKHNRPCKNKRQRNGSVVDLDQEIDPAWEIARALKCG